MSGVVNRAWSLLLAPFVQSPLALLHTLKRQCLLTIYYRLHSAKRLNTRQKRMADWHAAKALEDCMCGLGSPPIFATRFQLSVQGRDSRQ